MRLKERVLLEYSKNPTMVGLSPLYGREEQLPPVVANDAADAPMSSPSSQGGAN